MDEYGQERHFPKEERESRLLRRRRQTDEFGSPDFGNPELASDIYRFLRFRDWFWSRHRSESELIYWGVEYPTTPEDPYGFPYGRVVDGDHVERPYWEQGHVAVVGLSDVLVRQNEKAKETPEPKREMWDELF